MAMPVDRPGFAFRRARLAVVRLVSTLRECARAGCRRRCASAGRKPPPHSDDEDTSAGQKPPPHTDDEELEGFQFDFLFAAQDASTSSFCWTVSALDSHLDVLARVRAEVAAVWTPESGELVTDEQIQELGTVS